MGLSKKGREGLLFDLAAHRREHAKLRKDCRELSLLCQRIIHERGLCEAAELSFFAAQSAGDWAKRLQVFIRKLEAELTEKD